MSSKKRKKLEELTSELSDLSDLRDTRTVLLYGEIDQDLTKDVVENLTILTEKLSRRKSKDICLLISSIGGDFYCGLEIVGAIKRAQAKGLRVTGIVQSQAESMAFVVFQACDVRVLAPGGTLMVHGVSILPTDRPMDKLDLDLESNLMGYYIAFLSNELEARNPGYSREYWSNILRDKRPKYFTAADPPTADLVDKILL